MYLDISWVRRLEKRAAKRCGLRKGRKALNLISVEFA